VLTGSAAWSASWSGLVPSTFLASSALGIAAIVFGMIGTRRISRGEASNRAIAIAGLATGVAAFALSLAGLTIVMTGLISVSSDLDRLNTSAAPATQAQHAVVQQENRMVHQGLWIGNG
jgi:hypothetical protein